MQILQRQVILGLYSVVYALPEGDFFMPRSDAMDRAIKKYEQEKVDRVIFRVPKGMKEQMQAHAEARGESLAGFLNRAAQETMERDRAEK